MTNIMDMATINQATAFAKMIATLSEKDAEKLYYIIEGMRLSSGKYKFICPSCVIDDAED